MRKAGGWLLYLLFLPDENRKKCVAGLDFIYFFSSWFAMQTLKAALPSRVSIGYAQRLGSERQDLGHGEFCPAGANAPSFDEYGRPATANTLTVKEPYAAACGNYVFSAAAHMQFEGNHRPYVGTCAVGLRAGGDLGNQSRQYIPQNLYDANDNRGSFNRRAPFDEAASNSAIYRQQQPYSGSMDATSTVRVGK